MKNLRLPFSFVLILLTTAVHAQFWTTAVGTNPDPATACGPFELVIDGNKPASNYNLSSANVSISGSTITVDVVFTESGFGLPTITPVSYNVLVPAVPAGAYTVVVDYVAAGNTEISSWSINVDSCAATTCSPDPSGLSHVPNADKSVDLFWTAVPGSVACRVRGRILGFTAWATATPTYGVEPSTFRIPDLFINDGGNYEWQVQCACNLSPLTATGWSASGFFTAPILRQGMETAADGVFPNPARNSIRIPGPAAENEIYRVVDALGRTVTTGRLQQDVALEGVAPGMYWLILPESQRNWSFQVID